MNALLLSGRHTQPVNNLSSAANQAVCRLILQGEVDLDVLGNDGGSRQPRAVRWDRGRRSSGMVEGGGRWDVGAVRQSRASFQGLARAREAT